MVVKRLITEQQRTHLVNEQKIKKKMRELAIIELKKSKDLPADFEDKQNTGRDDPLPSAHPDRRKT